MSKSFNQARTKFDIQATHQDSFKYTVMYDAGRIKKGLKFLDEGASKEGLERVFGEKHAERIIHLHDKIQNKLACIVSKNPSELGFIENGKLTTKGEIEIQTRARYYFRDNALTRFLSDRPFFVRKDKFQCIDLGLELASKVTGPMGQAIQGKNVSENLKVTIKYLSNFILKRENLEALKDDYDDMELCNLNLFPVIDKALAGKAGILYGIYDMASEAVNEEEIFGDNEEVSTEFPALADSEEEQATLLDQLIEEHVDTSSLEIKRRNYILNLWKARKVVEKINPQEFWDQIVEPIIEFFTDNKVYGSNVDLVKLDKNEAETEQERNSFPYQPVILSKEFKKKGKIEAKMIDRGIDPKTGRWLGRDLYKVEKISYQPLKYPELALEEDNFADNNGFQKAEDWQNWRLKVTAPAIKYKQRNSREGYLQVGMDLALLRVKARWIREYGTIPDETNWEWRSFKARHLYFANKEAII